MGRNYEALLSSVTLAVCMTGCIVPPAEHDGRSGIDDAERTGESRSAVLDQNALTPNALTPNALTPNALTPNALTPNALTPDTLEQSALDAIRDPGEAGDLSRHL